MLFTSSPLCCQMNVVKCLHIAEKGTHNSAVTVRLQSYSGFLEQTEPICY